MKYITIMAGHQASCIQAKKINLIRDLCDAAEIDDTIKISLMHTLPDDLGWRR